MAEDRTIGFLGAGRMATALAQGIVKAGLVPAEQILAADIEPAAVASFARSTGAKAVVSNREVTAASTLVVAVKPAQVAEVLSEVSTTLSSRHLVISIAAGVTLAALERNVPAGVRVVRVMPNTPALVGASATGYAAGTACSPRDLEWVQSLFSSVGVAFAVKESLLDAVTGLSGSGPAYAYLMIEALSDGGVAAGLPRDVATRLAAQTLLGAARMVLESGIHPGQLKDQVTSPGGTTIEGLHELEKAGVRAGLITAVRAAADKSRRLGQG
ncbi:MAG: pyrroline-5-carboxylate reductase [Verrucomicrobiales bacterium]|nr:pyrroline-5-carboxylate reductase [Verrucomicrobiales bacterium]